MAMPLMCTVQSKQALVFDLVCLQPKGGNPLSTTTLSCLHTKMVQTADVLTQVALASTLGGSCGLKTLGRQGPKCEDLL